MQKDYYIEPKKKQPEHPDNSEQSEKKFDPQLAIIAMQTGICVVVIVACLIIKYFMPSVFGGLKVWYEQNIGSKTNIEQVLDDSGTSSVSQGTVSNPSQNSSGLQSSESSASSANENSSATSSALTESSISQGSGGPLEKNGDSVLVSANMLYGFAVPMKGTVTSGFGYRTDPFTGKSAMHSGYDIANAVGTQVVSAMSGTVEKAVTDSADYGNYVVIGSGKIKTLYGHLSKIGVKQGQTVTKQQNIGLCGSTGRSTGPHLHFEIIVNSVRIDPEPFLTVGK